MIKLQPINQLLEQLTVPKQDLAQLSFCDGERESSINAWVRTLPLTQIQFISGLLYQALPEVARFKTSPSNRLNILEALRQPCMQAAQGLAQHFLNQPIILPDSAIKNATITQALQKHLVNGYLVSIRDLGKSSNPEKELLALAIHRAITGLGILLHRYYQLYLPVSPHFWLELHSLFQIALHFKIADVTVLDNLPHQQYCNTISLAYARLLLLACARPNQLRQEEIIATYNALDQLAALTQLQSAEESSPNNLYAVAINGDRPPLYRSRFSAQEQESLLELNNTHLCKKLTEAAAKNNTDPLNTGSLHNEFNLTTALTTHLNQTWNLLAQRHFERKQAHGHLEVTVGITNIHFHLSGCVNFTHFLNKINSATKSDNADTIFQQRGATLKEIAQKQGNDDPWGDTFDIKGTALEGPKRSTSNIELSIRQQEDNEYHAAHLTYKVPLIDTSPGGYCLEWRDEIPTQVKAGELLALREPQRQRWSLGVVRWVNQTKGATQLGIQIISAQATPVGMAIIHKTGTNSEYLRAFKIPELKAINQPPSLITNAVSFREYSKAKIYTAASRSDVNPPFNVQLLNRLFATGTFSQFTYRELAGAPTAKTDSDDTDSAWKQ